MKKILFILMIARLGSSLSVNAQEAPRCTGGLCQRATPDVQVKGAQYPKWRDVQGQKNLIEVQEGNAWVQYKKLPFRCPNDKPQKGHVHHYGLNRTGAHASGRHVKYQRNQNGDIVDGIMNVKEQDACWKYVRTSNTRNASKNDAAVIKNVEEILEID